MGTSRCAIAGKRQRFLGSECLFSSPDLMIGQTESRKFISPIFWVPRNSSFLQGVVIQDVVALRMRLSGDNSDVHIVKICLQLPACIWKIGFLRDCVSWLPVWGSRFETNVPAISGSQNTFLALSSRTSCSCPIIFILLFTTSKHLVHSSRSSIDGCTIRLLTITPPTGSMVDAVV